MFSLKKNFLLLLSLVTLVFFTACAGNDGKDGKDGKNASVDNTSQSWVRNNYKAVNSFSCLGCHAGQARLLSDASYVVAKIIGTTAADNTTRDNYKGGVHFYSQMQSSGCSQSCHYKSSTDNIAMNDWFNFITDPTATLRIGVASCMECHGTGGGHYGKKAVQVKVPGGGTVTSNNMTATWDACSYCHTYGQGGNQHNPAHGNRYFTQNAGLAFANGKHGAGIPYTADPATGDIDAGSHYAMCGFCHTYNYSWKYNPMAGTKTDHQIEALMGETPLKDMANTGIGCATCHDPHTGDLNSKVADVVVTEDSYGNAIVDASGGARSVTVFSKEYVLCTSCHPAQVKYEWVKASGRFRYYLDNEVYGGAVGDSVSDLEAGAGHHYFARNAGSGGLFGLGYNGYFATNHFATKSGETAAIAKDNAGKIALAADTTGVGMNASSPQPCTACHDPHNSSRFAPMPVMASFSENEVTAANLTNIRATYAASPHAAYENIRWNFASFGGSKNCAPCHNGRQAAKFMERGAQNRSWSSNPYYGMQMSSVNGVGGITAGCGTCHDLDNTTSVNVGGLLNGTNAITGRLRALYGNNDTRNEITASSKFILPAGGSAGRADEIPAGMFKKQSDDRSLACFTCHAGRTSLTMKADLYGLNSQRTYNDNGTGYAHYGPAAGVVGGLLLPSVKNSTDQTPIISRVNDNDKSTWAKHSDSNREGLLFPRCADCHDINGGSHTFAVFMDSAGQALMGVVNKDDYTDTAKIGNIARISKNDPTGCYCHGNGSNITENIKTNARGFAEVMHFFEHAIQIKDANDKAYQYTGGYPSIFNVWNDTAGEWVGDSAANSVGYWTNTQGRIRFLTATVFETLHYDYGAYAHADRIAKDAIGESLKALYLLINPAGDADGFASWLSAPGSTADGKQITGLDSAGKWWLCGGSGCTGKYTDW